MFQIRCKDALISRWPRLTRKVVSIIAADAADDIMAEAINCAEPAYTRKDKKKISREVSPCCAASMPKAMPRGR